MTNEHVLEEVKVVWLVRVRGHLCKSTSRAKTAPLGLSPARVSMD